MNIKCKNNWRKEACCDNTTESYIHGIEITNGSVIIKTFLFPFEVKMTKSTLEITKNGQLSVYALNEFSETRNEIKSLIQLCAYGNPMERRTVKLTVDTNPVTEVTLPLNAGESHAGIYNVFAPVKVNEGSLPEDYTVLPNGNIEFNTEIPVEPEPYNITVEYWVLI